MPSINVKAREIYYEDQGSGFPIIFGHSYLWDNAMWQPQVEVLSATHRCIIPDLWGHGLSDPPPASPYSIKEIAEDIWTFTQALGLEKFAVVGLSVGGMWGAHLALNHPEAVSALILIGTYLGPEPTESQTLYFGMLDSIEKTGAIPASMQDSIVPFFFSPATIQQKPDMVARLKANMAAFSATRIPGIVGIGRGIFSRISQLDRLPEIIAPTVVVVGADDQSRPLHEAQQMAAIIPGAILKVIDEAGHICNLEQPKQVTEILDIFLAKTLPAP